MAKRKAARGTGRRKASKRAKSGGMKPNARRRRTASSAQARRRKTSAASARKAPASKSRKAAASRSRKAAARKTSTRTASARNSRARKATRRKVVIRRAALKTASRKTVRKVAARKRPPSARNVPAAVARKVPALNRERRTIADEDVFPTPPSSLDLDRTASAARSGRRELSEKFQNHTEASPAITGGDIDANWESAYSVGDEAPGGDSPTPDQDIVDDIGKALGVQYEDNEELKGEKKISDRDRKRWELDPASSEDYDDR